MDEQKQDDQQEHTYSSYVRIWDVAEKTCQRRWTIGKSGERGSGISVLSARHDDDGTKPFLMWVRAQDRSPAFYKIPQGSVSIPLKGVPQTSSHSKEGESWWGWLTRGSRILPVSAVWRKCWATPALASGSLDRLLSPEARHSLLNPCSRTAAGWSVYKKTRRLRVVIYQAFCSDVAQGRMNRVPDETQTHSRRFASLAG